jgi:hypothetical protein
VQLPDSRGVGIARVLVLSLALAACGREPPPPMAELSIFADVSKSSALVNADEALDQADQVISRELGEMMTGDRITLHVIGEARLELALGVEAIQTGVDLKISSAGPKVSGRLRQIVGTYRNSGGEEFTNIVRTLSVATPLCTPRSRILIFSDGVEDGQEYSAQQALKTGQPIVLPAPPSNTALAGCKIIWVGMGNTVFNPATSTGELMNLSQVQALRSAWTKYLEAAGVEAGDISFI